MPDPTRPLTERTPDELGDYLDDHLLMALEAALRITDHPYAAEDLIRNRLVALADTYPDLSNVRDENQIRGMRRLRALLAVEGG